MWKWENSDTRKMTDFEDLNTSTITMMLYSNLSFDLTQIFNHIPVTPVFDKKEEENR